MPPETLFRSSVALENLDRIETMLRGPDPFGKIQGFGGLQPPKWPSQIFPNDPAWKINQARVAKGRAIYAEICVECHLGPVNDPAFDKPVSPTRVFGPRNPLGRQAQVLNPVQKSVAGMGTDPAQANVLFTAKGRRSGLPEHAAHARARKGLGMSRYAGRLFDGNAVLDRPDDRGRPYAAENGWTITTCRMPIARHLWGTARRNCPNPANAEATALPCASIERSLGDRSLSPQRFGAFALLDAQACGRAPKAILHGLSRFRSAAGRLSRCRRGEAELQAGRNPVLERSTGRITAFQATALSATRWREHRDQARPASSVAC